MSTNDSVVMERMGILIRHLALGSPTVMTNEHLTLRTDINVFIVEFLISLKELIRCPSLLEHMNSIIFLADNSKTSAILAPKLIIPQKVTHNLQVLIQRYTNHSNQTTHTIRS